VLSANVLSRKDRVFETQKGKEEKYSNKKVLLFMEAGHSS
jgi:hypothetical protein